MRFALPYIVALIPAAIQGLALGLLAQARALGAGRLQLSALALREAKVAVIAAVIAALGATISEVGAVVIVGGNFQGHDETLASALLEQFNYTANEPYATAIAVSSSSSSTEGSTRSRRCRPRSLVTWCGCGSTVALASDCVPPAKRSHLARDEASALWFRCRSVD